MKSFKNIDSYIRDYPNNIQKLLKQIRTTIKPAATSKATEAVKYGIPTYILNDKNLVHFGGFKSHIGFFPSPGAITAFKKDLTKYKLSKGTIQFPIDKPLPIGLIKKIVKFRVKQTLTK